MVHRRQTGERSMIHRRTQPSGQQRSWHRIAAWLGVFALLVQMVVAAGHVHALPLFDQVAAVSGGTTGDADDDCAVCATLQAGVGTVLRVAAPPSPGAAATLLPPSHDRLTLRRLYTPKVTRAPPVA